MQNKSTIGYLSKQYRSILKKCFLISVGFYAFLGSANAQTVITSNLRDAISNTTYNDRTYNLKSTDTPISSSLPSLTFGELTITNTDDITLDGNLKRGIRNSLSTTLTLDNIIATNFSTGDSSIAGAVVENTSGTVNINKSSFTNTVIGGVLRNSNTNSTINIYNTTFQNNVGTSYGSGDISNSGTVYIEDSYFLGGNTNSIGNVYLLTIVGTTFSDYTNTTGSSTNGGAINNKSDGAGSSYLYINVAKESNVIVMKDSVQSKFLLNQAVLGGAIYNNEKSSIEASNVLFDSNKAQSGGAIYNHNNIIIHNSTFTNNVATNANGGGAIYNAPKSGLGNATISIDAINKDVLFKGNTANGVSNAIYNEGTINLSSTGNYSITSYDGFSGTGDYNLTSGTLKLLEVNAGFASNSKLNITAGAIISTIDDEINTTSLGTLKLSGDIYYGMDVNLSSLQGDKLTGSLAIGSSGSILIDEINVLGTSSANEIIINISGDFNSTIDIQDAKIVGDEGYNIFSYDGAGNLVLKKGRTLNDAVLETGDVIYIMNGSENVTTTLGTMAGSILSITGNNNNITATGGADGIIMGNGQTLNLNNVGIISGFANSFITATGGNIGINVDSGNATTFENSILGSGNIIINADASDTGSVTFNNSTSANTITVSNGTATFGGTVNATTITNGANTTFNNAVNASITNSSNITANNTSITGSITNSGDITLDSSSITGAITGSGSVNTTGTSSFAGGSIANTINIGSGTTTFTGSTINGIVNASGNVSFVGDVTLNGVLTTSSTITNAGTLNLNSNLALSNTFTGGAINLGNTATLSLESGGSLSGLTSFNAASGTKLDVAEGAIGSYNLGTFGFASGSNLEVDMSLDLSTGNIISDTITGSVVAEASNVVAVSIGNLLNTGSYENISGKSGFIEIFEVGSVTVNPLTSSSVYTISTRDYTLNLSTATNGLNYNIFVGANTLANSITSIITPREYIMSATTPETAGVGNLTGTMIITGNGSTITDGTISLQDNASLTINNATVNATVGFAGDDASLTLSGSTLSTNISSSSTNSVINFNAGSNITGTMSGVTANINTDLNRTSQDTDVSYNLNSGTLSFGDDAFLSGNNNSINFNGGSLNLINNKASTISLNNLTLTKDASIYLDVDLGQTSGTPSIDNFDVTTFDANGHKLNILGLNILDHSAGTTETVTFTTNQNIINATEYLGQSSIETTALSPIYVYDVLYNQGVFTFTRQSGDSGFTPNVQQESVSTQGIYNTNIDFAKNMLAALDAYSPIQGRSTGDDLPEIGGAWVKVYGSDEDVDLGALNVDSKTYAGVLGVDAKPEYYDYGIRGIYSIYLAYLQSEQNYSDVNIEQNGINFGGRAMFDKDNWYVGGVANLGFNLVDGTSSAGKEDFETYTASISLKTGYDIDLHCQQYILQPNITMSYLYAITPDYTNASNVRIKSDGLHAFNINPELKFIAHLDNGYSPYASVGYNWNVEGGGDITADNIALPELSVDPYAEFKLGFTKENNQGLSGYAEAFATTGGRQGYGAQAGLKINF